LSRERPRPEQPNPAPEARAFSLLAPAGYHIALRVGFAFPLVERNALPPLWIDEYTREKYMIHDPVMRWIYTNDGHVRWSEIGLADPLGILPAAAAHGLRYGVAVSLTDAERGGQRSFGSFARADREFTQDEIAVLSGWLHELHAATASEPGADAAGE